MEYAKDSVDRLIKAYGSPLYVFDQRGFTENYGKLQSAMQTQYENYRIAYSFKTNYTPYICKTAKTLGAYAEVVSDMEYVIAKKLGYDDCHIIFNGPEKAEEGIDAFLNGCIFNVDNIDELQHICEEAQSRPDQQFKIGIRINLDLGQNFVSRFGMDETDVKKAFRIVEEIDNLSIVGLHCHISRCRNLEAWKKRTEFILALADHYFTDVPEYLDLGSGMYGSMAPEFAEQFGEIPTYEEYAEVTAKLVSLHYRGKNKPILFTEPGTTLVNRFVDCIAKVKAIKQIRNHSFAVLDVSEHILGETCTLKKLPVKVIPGGELQEEYESIDLTGYTCLEQDILYSGFCGRIAKGDYIVFGNTGGYANVLKPPFIRPCCAMIAETADGQYQLIKETESYSSIFQTYVF